MTGKILDVHPDLRQSARRIPAVEMNWFSMRLMRIAMRLLPRKAAPAGVTISEMIVPRCGGGGNVRVRLYRPSVSSSPSPVLMWMHGGGFVIGKPVIDDPICNEFVQRLGIVVVSVDYRLSPGLPYPAALDDCYAILKWVHLRASELGIDPARIAVGGASAGGGLAAALCCLARDRQEFSVVFQLLVYPMLDDRTAYEADTGQHRFVGWTRRSNRFAWRSYLGALFEADDVPPYAAPARCEELNGLPATWIGVGDLDLFFEENVAFASRLEASGVACELVVVSGAFHGFDVFANETALVQDFRRSQVEALRRHLCDSGGRPVDQKPRSHKGVLGP